MQLIPTTAAKFAGPIAAGAGVVLLAPVVMPFVGGVLKPVTKTVIKGGILAYNGVQVAYDKVKVKAAEAVETIEDIAAEAQAELAEKSNPKTKAQKPQDPKKNYQSHQVELKNR
jgi:hypothetical protein